MNAIVESAWVTLWQKPGLLDFTSDAASGAIWIFLSLTIRSILSVIGIMKFIPEGLLFSFPLLVMYLVHQFGLHFMDSHYPLLPVRIAESFLGRIPKNRIIFVIIGNIMGCFFGVSLFYLCFSWLSSNPNTLLLPIRTSAFGNNDIYAQSVAGSHAANAANLTSEIGGCAADSLSLPGCGYYNNASRVGSGWLMYHVAIDAFTSFFFCVTVLVLPEILQLNRQPVYFAYAPVALLLLVHSLLVSGDSLSAGMHPTAGATLWYLHMSPVMEAWSVLDKQVPALVGAAAAAGAGDEVIPLLPHLLRLEVVRWFVHMGKCVLLCFRTYVVHSTLFVEQFAGVIIGGAMAGVFCHKFTPDEPTWKRRY